MFVVGSTYENRRGRYVVLAIKADKLHVRYEDGIAAMLDAVVQMRIISKMRRVQNAQQAQRPPRRASRSTTRSHPAVRWTRHDLWNRAIFDRFFEENISGRLAYIDLDDEELTKIAPDEQASRSPRRNFVRALASTLDVRGARLLDEHFGRLRQWKNDSSPVPPPFIAVLGLFCLAAQGMRSDDRFAASNYYDRLAQLLFGEKYTRGQREVLRSGFQKAHLLWGELEGWLRSRGGQHGLPSAQPMYRLAHVGYPISQSLLRANDRNKLPELFEAAELEAGQMLPPGDMERIMDPWVPVSPLSQAAKSSWKDTSARRRMAEAASLELGAWSGRLLSAEESSQHVPNRPIAVEVRIMGGPKPGLNWSVVLPMPPDTLEATFEVDGEGRGLPSSDGYIRKVRAYRGLGDRWSEPFSDVSVADLLVVPVVMVAEEDHSRCTWQPRKVIVLTWDDETKVFRSQRRSDFGRRSMVLAYKTVAADVRIALSAADEGEMRQVPEPWGVPQDWTVFMDVRLARIPDVGGNDDLAALVPDVWSSVEWNGGISLPGKRQWLPSRLPTVSIKSIEEIQRLTVGIDCKTTLDNTEAPPIVAPLEYVGNGADVDLSHLELTDGVYGLTITAYRGERDKRGEDLSRQTFEVRSSKHPLSGGPESLLYRSDKEQWGLSASSSSDGVESGAVTVRGAFVQPQRDLISPVVEPPGDVGSTGEAEQEDITGPGQSLRRVLEDMAECFRGAHYFVLPSIGSIASYYRQTITGECTRCGLRRKYTRSQRKRVRSERMVQRPLPHRGSAKSETPIPIARTPDSTGIDYEGLLEACFALGGGPWSHFELLARQSSNVPAFPHEVAQLFSALGHIDLELNSTRTRVRQWKAAPPVVVITSTGHMYLSGYRFRRLIEAVEKAVNDCGGTFTSQPSEGGPKIHTICGLDQESLASVVESVYQTVHVRLNASIRPDRSVAASLPPLRSALTADRIVSEPDVVSHFDVSKASWSTADSAGSDGLYRTDSMPRSYLLRTGPSWYEVPYRVGKHLAGVHFGRSLLAYDSQEQHLVCPLGAQLPGLYERTVVLSSGVPPVVDLRQAKVFYRDVPMDIASRVWSLVYSQRVTEI